MSTVDNSGIVGTKTGPELVTEIATQFGNTDTELDARPEAAQAETISGAWTFTAAPIMVSSDGVAEAAVRWAQGTLESGHTTEHELRVFMNSDGTDIALRPYIDGVATAGKEFRFEFDNERWVFAADLRVEGDLHVGGQDITGGAQTLDLLNFKWGTNDIYHAGNFDPSSKSDTTHGHNLADLDDVDTTGRADTNSLEWDTTTSKYIHVTKPTGGGSTNLTLNRTASAVTIYSDTGTDVTINEADSTDAGVMTTTHHDNLDDLVANAIKDGDFTSNGLMIRTADGSYTSREITGGNEITVSNGTGVSGDPTVALTRSITSGTGAASGGSNGDIHFRYA